MSGVGLTTEVSRKAEAPQGAPGTPKQRPVVLLAHSNIPPSKYLSGNFSWHSPLEAAGEAGPIPTPSSSTPKLSLPLFPNTSQQLQPLCPWNSHG